MDRMRYCLLRRRWPSLIGFLLLIYLFLRTDTDAFLRHFANLDLSPLLISVGLNLPLIFLKAFRWKLIMKDQKLNYPVVSAFLSYSGSLVWGLLTPGRIGEFVRAFHGSHDLGVPKLRIVPSILADRLLDVYLLAFMGSIIFSVADVDPTIKFAVVFLLPLTLSGFIFFFHRIDLDNFLSKAHSKWSVKVLSYAKDIISAISVIKFRTILIGATLTCMAYLVIFFQGHFLLLSLRSPISPWDGFSAIILGSLVMLIPISISGLGSREAVFVYFLSTKGIPSDEALIYSLMVFLAIYAAGGILGAISLLIKPIPWHFFAQEGGNSLNA